MWMIFYKAKLTLKLCLNYKRRVINISKHEEMRMENLLYLFFLLSFHRILLKHPDQHGIHRHSLVMKNLTLEYHAVIISFRTFKSIWYCGIICTQPRLRFLQLHLYLYICYACVTRRIFRSSDYIRWRK